MLAAWLDDDVSASVECYFIHVWLFIFNTDGFEDSMSVFGFMAYQPFGVIQCQILFIHIYWIYDF